MKPAPDRYNKRNNGDKENDASEDDRADELRRRKGNIDPVPVPKPDGRIPAAERIDSETV